MRLTDLQRTRPFLLSLALLLGNLAIGAQVVEQKNVLIFFIDDLRPELACYGADLIKSPRIDELADQGVLFERAYCQQAICGPSRISMMAGKYPDRLGIQDLFSPLRKNIPDAMSLPRYFKEAGYVTLSYGKVYHHHSDDKENWSDLPARPGELYADRETLDYIKSQQAEARRLGLSELDAFNRTRGPAVEAADVVDEAYRDGAVALQAIESLRMRKDQLFFMCVGFAKPHLPFSAPKRYWDLYRREQFSVPARTAPHGAPQIAFTNWNELRAYKGMPKKGPLSDAQTAELRHGYAAAVSYADAQVGKVLDELDRLGLRDKTIVVLWGDHGYKLGEYGDWCKHTNFELDTRVPFIVSVPGGRKAVRTDALVEMIDIFPTLAALTGGRIPQILDGKNLQPVLEDPNASIRKHALSQYPRGDVIGYSLRSERWRYTEWVDRKTKDVVERELYDHTSSQVAILNQAGDPSLEELMASLSAELNSDGRLSTQPLRKNK